MDEDEVWAYGESWAYDESALHREVRPDPEEQDDD